MADERHLDLIEQGVEKWNLWRQENPEILPDLRGAYLFEAELSGANLRGVNLSRACLIGTNLKQANLSGANLQSLYASAANLEWADLSEADLKQANLSEARLAQVNFSHVSAEGTNFSKADLTGACIENWQVNAKTDFSDTQCDYLYRTQPRENRYPEEGTFTPAAFGEFIGQLLTTQTPEAAPTSSAPLLEEPVLAPPVSMGTTPKPSAGAIAQPQTTIPTPTPVNAPRQSPASRPRPTSTSRSSRLSLHQWRLVAGGSLIGLVVAIAAFVSLLSRIITSRSAETNPPSYLVGPDVNLASLPCNELPPPDLQSQEPSFTYTNGVSYYGQFEDGIPSNGRGTMVFSNGDRYDGEFENGERNGCGTFTFASGRQYMGQFRTDQFHGVGIWKLETGERYVGQFEYNKCEGWGTFLFADGSSKSGTWEDGNLMGDNLSCNRGIASEPEETTP
ncbi:MAG: pentapeptide repeat-containing protein [Cyanobacteria bacterium J06559_3]